MKPMNNADVFKDEISLITDPILRQAVIDTLNSSPTCIQVVPASSTGKYHSKGDCAVGYIDKDGIVHTGGLVNHIKSVVAVCKTLMRNSTFNDIVIKPIRESKENADFEFMLETVYSNAALAACIIHDCMKPDMTAEHRTRFDHPLLAAELFVESIDKYIVRDNKNVELKLYKRLISLAVSSHMGQYNTSQYSDIVLPTPQSGLDIYVHMCDYIASRRFIDIDLTKVQYGD